jgi:hypothetical protein
MPAFSNVKTPKPTRAAEWKWLNKLKSRFHKKQKAAKAAFLFWSPAE